MNPVDVTVVTGFLGSGKTTLINRLLADPALRDTAVIVNEFGEVAIDHLLVEESGEDIIEIAGGCLCCTVRGELAETLADLVDRVQTGRIGRLARIVIETTGLADPVPVLHAIQGDPALAQALRIDRVITTVDAIAGAETLAAHDEARRQVAAADIAVISKTDLAEPQSVTDLGDKIETFSAARIFTGRELFEDVSKLLTIDVMSGGNRPAAADPPHHGHAHHHEHGHSHHHGGLAESVAAHVIAHPSPISWRRIENFLDHLRSSPEHELLRMKGIIETSEDPDRPIVVHGVQRMLYPPRSLETWPKGATRGATLVIIGRGLDTAAIDRQFKAFLDIPMSDTPDRTALMDNPLAIPGVR